MKKTLIALAALAATASYAQTTVEVYGRAHIGYDATYKATGGTAMPGGAAVALSTPASLKGSDGSVTPFNATGGSLAAGAAYNVVQRSRVADDGSRIGFRVREELGGGAYARAVIETGVNLDTNSANGQSGAANSGTGFLGSRDAWVGVGNAMGDIRMGRQNNFWGNGAIEDVGANRIHFAITGMYTAPSSGWVNGPAARVDNTLKFVANQGLAGAFAGSEVWIAKPVAAETAAPIVTSSTTTTKNDLGEIKAKSSGYTLKYTNGPIAAQYDWATNKNMANGVSTTTANDSGLTGSKLGLAYTYATGSKVYVINSTFKQEFNEAAANNVVPVTPALGALATATNLVPAGYRKQSNNMIGVQHRMGAWELHAVYANQGNVKQFNGTEMADSGSKAYTLGARYELSNRTALTVATTEVKNGKNNNINNSGGGQSSTAAIGFGAKLSQTGVSIQHNF